MTSDDGECYENRLRKGWGYGSHGGLLGGGSIGAETFRIKEGQP